MKRLPLSLIAAFGLLAFVLTSGVLRSIPVVVKIADEDSLNLLTDPARLHLQGVGSCSAASCHGYNGPKGSKGSEYTTWVTHDPHSRAYTVLFEERSRLIEKNLHQLERLALARPEKDPLCLSCHVYPAPDLETSPRHERFFEGDGVGCEACHGRAEKWLSTHYRVPKGTRQLPGMIDTRDLRTRAEVCVRCHVGEREMDVNHDLIAAGHPRLRFEYGAYLANYHFRHWKERDDTARDADHEARAWMIGQLVSARKALELLSYRAANARKPWPEFAEYNCAACHHNLTGKDENRPRGPGRLPVGALPWGTWYQPMVPILAAQLTPERELTVLKRLPELMSKRLPDRSTVVSAAQAGTRALEECLQAMLRTGVGKERLEALLAELARSRGNNLATWESATQLYLGIAALHQALSDLDAAYGTRPGTREAVRGLGAELQNAFSEKRENLYSSPSRFDPAAIERRLKEIEERLRSPRP
jgi:hypothetical protein